MMKYLTLVEEVKMKKSDVLHLVILFNNFLQVYLLEPLARELNITPSQLTCLRYLYLHSGVKLNQVAEGLKVSCGAASRLLDRLEEKGLLTRKIDEHDRRVQQLILTSEGKAIVEKSMGLMKEKFSALLDKFSTDEHIVFEEFLTMFLQKSLDDPEIVKEMCLRCGDLHKPDCLGNVIFKKLVGKELKG
jgi:DNA-binding MarR family transcriptional regulator